MNNILVGKDINFLAKLDYGFFYDIIVFMIGSSLSNRMKRVFLNSAHKLGLLWNGSNYVLKDFKKPFCHPLEVCLIGVDNLSCENKDASWDSTIKHINHLKVYAELRKDPQAEAIGQAEESLKKAKDSKSAVFCDNIVKLNRTRINVVADAWRGR